MRIQGKSKLAGNKAAGVQVVLTAILLVFFATLVPAKVSRAAEKTVYSVPTRQFLAALAAHGIEPALHEKLRSGHWQRVSPFAGNTACRLSRDGELSATASSSPPLARWCELTLFEPHYTLAPGWTIQRLHWRGDTRSAQFLGNPVRSRRAHIRVRLPVISRQAGRRHTPGSVTLHLVSLRGPANSRWTDAFRLEL